MDRLDTEGQRIWFRFPSEYSTGQLDASPFLPALLVTSMWWREQLTIDGPVSARLLTNAHEAMELYRCLFPSLHEIAVSAPPRALPPDRAATSCFFSRGVDSWYSVLKNLENPDPRRPPLTHLVYVPSIDFMYSDANRARATEDTRRASDDIGCELVVLETNLRQFTEQFQHWGVTYGGGLAAIALALGDQFSDVLLPASTPIGAPNFSGSHVALDPLWSTERTAIVHDGAEARRIDKVQRLSDHPEVLPQLKVCFVEDTTQNCGRCQKCLITTIELHIAGLLDECPAFERPVDPRAVAKMPDPGWQSFFFEEALAALGDGPLDVALRLALEKVLLRRDVRASRTRLRRLATTRLLPLGRRRGG
jgi:hypothetical protein